MAGKKFLNPVLKATLCSIGIACMAYLLIPQVGSGGPYDYLTLVRALVLLGFVYLLIQTVKDILRGRENTRNYNK
jgi:hypothetical protein